MSVYIWVRCSWRPFAWIMEDGINVRLARTAVVIRAGGAEPVGRALVQCHHQPPRPFTADREPEEQAQQEADETEIITVDSSSSADEGVQEFFYENLLERLREEDARKARRARQESGVLADVSEEQEQKRRRQEGQPTRSRAAHYDSVAWVALVWMPSAGIQFVLPGASHTMQIEVMASCCLTLSCHAICELHRANAICELWAKSCSA